MNQRKAALSRLVESFRHAQQTAFVMLPFAKSSQAILDDDDRSVDNQTEIERAQTH